MGRSLMLLLLLAGAPLSAQGQSEGRVAGRVTGASGSPLGGVAVSVEGTARGTVTADDGRYEIAGVPAGARTLRASRIGLAEATQRVNVTAGGIARADFQLAAQAVQLEGVVAVGYGTQRRKDVTGSVSSVDVDQVRTAPVTSVDQVLQGRAAGVQVTQNNGAPGGGLSVRIRGTNSISANSEPLYVIDGVPAFVGSGSRNASSNALSDLSPNDIESIEILKDASATAIYGSRGANGVVLITTRRGRRGENRVQFESSVGTQEITRTIPVLDARQFAELHNEARAAVGLAPAFPPSQIDALGAGTDWQDEIFRTAPIQNHALTISGGDDRTRYLVTGSLFDQEGIIINSGFRRYSARINLDREVSSRFRIGNNLTVSRVTAESSDTDGGPSGGVVAAALEFAPTVPVRDAEGRYIVVSPLNANVANPVATASEIRDSRLASRLVGNVFGEYDLSDALRFRTSFGGTALFQREDFYAPRSTIQGERAGGSGSVNTRQSSEVVNDNLLTYNRSLRDGHNIDLTTGFTAQTFRADVLRAQAEGFATDITGSDNLGAGALPLSPGSDVDEWTLLSGLARVNYNLLGRYLFTATGRYDGSSKFGANNKWGFFPSAALGWRISDEPFLQGKDWLSDAKLRLSYGITGNQEIGTYASLAQLQAYPYVLGANQVVTYAYAGQAPNPDLKWETTRQFNGGFDLGFWDNRFTLTADVYAGTTNDLLLRIPLPRTSGFDSQLRNVGSVKNRGVELSVATVNVERDGFTWRTALNVARNRNEVVDLGGPERIFPANVRGAQAFEGGVTNVVEVGRPLGTFFGYRTDGIWQLGDNFRSSGDPFAAPGEWRYVDVNGDGKITPDDRTILGDANADWFGGLTNNLTLGPLTLDVFLQANLGNEVVNGTAVFFKSVTTSSNESAESYNRWTPQNPSNTVPRANLNRARRLLDVYVEDGSFVRLQNVTLGYTVPEGLVPRAQRARIYASGQNLWVSSDYTGYDPEVNSYGGDASLRGVDFGMYPRSRTLNLGVNLTF